MTEVIGRPHGPDSGRASVASGRSRRQGKWPSLLLGSAAVLSAFRGPEFRIPGGFFVVDLVLVVIMATAIIGFRPRRHWVPARMVIGIGLVTVGLMLGTLLGGGPPLVEATPDLARDIFPPLAFVAAVSLHPRVSHYARHMAVAVAVVAAVAVVVLLTGGAGRQSAFLDQPNYAGHFLVIGWIVFAGVWSGTRIFLLATFGVMLLAVVRTGSFGVLAGLAGMITYLAFSRWNTSVISLRGLSRVVLVGVFGATALLSFNTVGQSEFDFGNGTDFARFNRSSTSRIDIWTNSLNLYQENPLGIGSNKEVDGIPLRQYIGAGEPHNDLLTMLIRGGFLAALGEVLVIAALWKLFQASSWSRAMLVFWLVTAMSRQTWNFRHFWLCLALVYLVEEMDGRHLSAKQKRRHL